MKEIYFMFSNVKIYRKKGHYVSVHGTFETETATVDFNVVNHYKEKGKLVSLYKREALCGEAGYFDTATCETMKDARLIIIAATKNPIYAK